MTERRVAIKLDDLAVAFEEASDAVRCYLDRETGAVIALTDEVRAELEAIYEDLDDEHGVTGDVFAAALQRRELPEWMRAMVYEADAVERGYRVLHRRPKGRLARGLPRG